MSHFRRRHPNNYISKENLNDLPLRFKKVYAGLKYGEVDDHFGPLGGPYGNLPHPSKPISKSYSPDTSARRRALEQLLKDEQYLLEEQVRDKSPSRAAYESARLNTSHHNANNRGRANIPNNNYSKRFKKGMNNARRRVEQNRLNATRSLPRNNRTNIMSNSTRRLFNARNARSVAEANAVGRSRFPWNNTRISSAIPTAPVYRPPPPQLVKCPKCSSQIQPPPGAPIYACGSCGQHMRSPY